MTTIKHADLVQSVADALQFISYYHPRDYIQALGRAYEREQSGAAKDAIAQILTNSRMCAEGHRPICQDTGIVNVFLKVGMEVRFEGFKGSLEDAVNEGVRRGYMDKDNPLRASVLKVKLATAIIGISSIHLLKTFINAAAYDEKTLIAQTGIHVTFLLSAMAIAASDRLMPHAGPQNLGGH